MSAPINGGPDKLTGVWQGLYSYAGGREPVSFVATLIEAGSGFSGATHETVADPRGGGSSALALAFLSGSCEGHAVAFTKTYDGSAGWRHSVAYDGNLNGDRSEIEGRWIIPGEASGRFLMIREKGVAKKAKRKVAEKA